MKNMFFSSCLIVLPQNLMLFAVDSYFSSWSHFLVPALTWTHPFYLYNCYPGISFGHISKLSLFFLGSHYLMRNLRPVQFSFFNRCFFLSLEHLEFSILLNILKLHETIIEWDVLVLRLLCVFLALDNILLLFLTEYSPSHFLFFFSLSLWNISCN